MSNGPLLRFLAKAQPIVITLSIFVLVYFRSIDLLFLFTGSTLCAYTAKGLKLIIRQPRPSFTMDPSISKKDSYGMPSSHSQVMAFFAYYTFRSVFRDTPLAIFLYIFTFLVLWSRVRMGHHTLAQVSVGTCIGALMAHAWYNLWLSKVELLQPFF
ncbi:PAP2 superfamily-domain-containing protein [Phascolomyces articulosus]|uniref:PAP2 superfamily-domain-containing protein n=1 Tax=Phascolomyces articulosus TaxID=60185 RepID=A0AAD5K369_9FUNG|nr:PAP2 superfamily-domain-containing protein [Phascolomyces articulosus]